MVVATVAGAQPIPVGCGAMQRSNQAYQGPSSSLPEVRAIIRTSRDITLCPINLQTEGWIEGLGGAHTAYGNSAATIDFTEDATDYARYTTTGKHWAIYFPVYPGVGAWEDLGNTTSEVTLVAPPSGDGPSDPLPCDTDPAWPGCNSPIIVDLANNGYQLTSVEDGVSFDLDGDGVPEQVAWTEANSDDVFLAIDRNGNGVIDNGSELFGNHFPLSSLSNGEAHPPADNGFEALKYLQAGSYGVSRQDDRIDGHDAAFARLLFWRDANHNGISEPEELTSVTEAGLLALSTQYRKSRRVDQHGNEFRLRAWSFWSDGGRRPVYDVWLRTQYSPRVTPAATQ